MIATDNDPGINLAIIYNPLDLSSRETAQLVWQEDRTLSAYLDGLPTGDDLDWIVTVNGGIVKEDEWAVKTLDPDDYLIIVPIPAGGGGGGGGKQIMMIVAMIAMAVVAAVLAPMMVGALAGVEGAVTGSSVGMAMGVSATMGSAILGVTGGLIPITGTAAITATFPNKETP